MDKKEYKLTFKGTKGYKSTITLNEDDTLEVVVTRISDLKAWHGQCGDIDAALRLAAKIVAEQLHEEHQT